MTTKSPTDERGVPTPPAGRATAQERLTRRKVKRSPLARIWRRLVACILLLGVLGAGLQGVALLVQQSAEGEPQKLTETVEAEVGHYEDQSGDAVVNVELLPGDDCDNLLCGEVVVLIMTVGEGSSPAPRQFELTLHRDGFNEWNPNGQWQAR